MGKNILYRFIRKISKKKEQKKKSEEITKDFDNLWEVLKGRHKPLSKPKERGKIQRIQVEKFYLLKVVIVEIDDSGLYQLRKKYLNRFAQKFIKSVGVDIDHKNIIINNERYGLNLWTVSLKAIFGRMLPTIFKGARGVVILVDSFNILRLIELKELIKNIRDEWLLPDIDIPILLVYNTQKLTEFSEEDSNKVDKYIRELGLDEYIEVSVDSGENIEEMFVKITKMILKSKYWKLKSSKR